MEITAEKRQIRRDKLVPVGPHRGGHLFHDKHDGTSYWLEQGGGRSGGGAAKAGAWVGALVGAPLIQLVGTALVGETGSHSPWSMILIGMLAAFPLALVFELAGVRQKFDLVVVRATTSELLEVRRANSASVRNTVLFVLVYPLLVALLGWVAQDGTQPGVSITFAMSIGLFPMWLYALRWSVDLRHLVRVWKARTAGAPSS
ncbi:MAG: hypothetical protein L0H81_05425 [Actinomyces sp.]|nr:hypothetical protein [Actinomyces sp.]MDN6429329.1 hypothetical protein [Propionibacterium sp.]MDN6566396.1 hypothetical protein [Actinomyces sp.]MDN6795320.1 hypothetical protein [Propionibacterium sp.]